MTTPLFQIRFIKCNDDETVSEIIRFNNSQNPLLPSDFKSNDTVQRRLRDEFKLLGSCKYLGGRRGIDRLSSLEGLIPSDSAAQALAAFHQRPDIAYHQKAQIWRDDALYELFFRADTTARHVLFAFSLLKAVEEKKQQLRLKGNSRNEQEEQQFGFFCKRGAILLLTAVIAGSLESLLGKKVPTKFRLSFKSCTSSRNGITKWQPIVDMLVAFSAQLTVSIENGLKDEDNNTKAVASFGQNIQAMRAIQATADVFNAFSATVVET